MKKLVVVIVALEALLLGCQQPDRKINGSPDKPPVFYEDISWVSLMVDLPLLDDDDDKQPDGVLARVMLLRPNQPDFVAGKGTVVFHLIKRIRVSSGNFENREIYKWTISEEEFTRSVVRQRFGLISHQVALYWGKARPKGKGIYLQAEFIRPDGKKISSRQVSIILPAEAAIGD